MLLEIADSSTLPMLLDLDVISTLYSYWSMMADACQLTSQTIHIIVGSSSTLTLRRIGALVLVSTAAHRWLSNLL